MDIKNKLKERLLEIPDRSRAYREKNRLSSDLNVEVKTIEPYLDELCNDGLLIRKTEYICKSCNDTIILIDKLISDNTFDCENCSNLISSNHDKTGLVYYDVEDYDKLLKW